jgi:hypothetical protein
LGTLFRMKFRSTQVRSTNKRPASTAEAQPGVFGVPLEASIPYANVAISLFHDDGSSYIYGYIPIVVAKTGVYLKEKGKCDLWILGIDAKRLTNVSYRC